MLDDRVGLPEADLRRGINERARLFEEEVADLFRLLGYKATVDVLTDNRQYDVVIEKDNRLASKATRKASGRWRGMAPARDSPPAP
jgi:hypothetical protein